MESTNKPPVNKAAEDLTVVEFLPDADEIERRPLPRLARITLLVLVAGLFTFIIFASFAKIDKVVVARGKLVTPSSNIIVQPLETSIIQTINVQVGQVVKKGQVLAVLDATFAGADQAELKSRLSSLETQSKNLEAELGGAKNPNTPAANADTQLQARLSLERQANYQAQLTRLEETVARLRASLETNRKDQQLLESRVQYLREMEAMQEKLVEQQYGARANYLAAQDKRLEVEREMLNTKNRENEIKRELAGSTAEKAAFEKSWRQKAMEDLLSTTRDRNSVTEQLQKADRRNKLITLVAPSDAVVLDIAKLSLGSIIKEAEPLFTLVPVGTELEAEVQIDSVDVGYIKLHDKVHVKLDAFPFQQHGTLSAEVRTISEDAFKRDAGNLGQGLDAYYVSRLGIGKVGLKKMTEKARLLPGMTLSAEIVVGKRSVMSYLLWPLTKALDEGLREP
ncbi:HlyD family type I secretion periplasmic adaptor subunit [Undibacterium terreum]|uniref:Membrane fusion protein (MFP) family protein n=1 Tax=Undibacterium terreum TaxID=1224302 RepID=A0A916V276_9BURK|nr:HlyD family type I secretion periplasmic adaptor subunit [Undibacterium terreum]GGC99905.1 membrane-fusion protein [Undibacterium terreum]